VPGIGYWVSASSNYLISDTWHLAPSIPKTAPYPLTCLAPSPTRLISPLPSPSLTPPHDFHLENPQTLPADYSPDAGLPLILVFPIVMIGVVSFWQFNGYSMVPSFTLDNYLGIFTSDVTLRTYLNTFKFVVLVWFFTLIIGYPVAYFLSFHVKELRWQIILFLICTIPFWTSNIIRMISWVPLLGKEGLVNQILLGHWPGGSAPGVFALLRLCGGVRDGPSLHHFYDCPHLQQFDAH
jgi:hypothetical protein